LKIELSPPYLTVEEVESLKTAEAEILDEGKRETAEFGDNKREVYRFTIKIREKDYDSIWTPNQRSLTNLVKLWGSDSKSWIGHTIQLKVERSTKGQKMIVAYPE